LEKLELYNELIRDEEMMNMGNYKERLVANAKLAEQKALDKIEGDAKRQA